jgi:RHS repeat-associated protein
MTAVPKPAAPTSAYSCSSDAWNRLVKVADGASLVAQYAYDGARRRTVKLTYSGGLLSETRDLYYSEPGRWQVVEERVGGSSAANRQFVWGQRYPDDLVLRARDSTGGGTLNERLYALQDPNWNVTAVADGTGAVQERYGYDAYGVVAFLTPAFSARGSSSYGSEVLYAGYRWDSETGLYQVRRRAYAPHLGCWLQRDPLGYGTLDTNLYRYIGNRPTIVTDPSGLGSAKQAFDCWVRHLIGRTRCHGVCVCETDTIGDLTMASILEFAAPVCCKSVCRRLVCARYLYGWFITPVVKRRFPAIMATCLVREVTRHMRRLGSMETPVCICP